MFKNTRRKIVVSIMSILVCIYAGTLGIIYASSYFDMRNKNSDMLRQYTDFYPTPRMEMNEMIGKDRPGMGYNKNGFGIMNAPEFRLSVFYSVEVSDEGSVIKINNNENTIYSDSDLEEIALEILSSNKDNGIKNNLIYMVADKGDYKLIAFMDNFVMQEGMSTLFRYTLIIGGIALVALFFVAVYLARRIVKPVEESYLKQKQFISDAGHELKTPVSVVSANAENLEREIGKNIWLENIQYENERMGNLVRNLLELVRNEDVDIIKTKVDFSRLIKGEALAFEAIAFERKMTIEQSIDDNIYLEGNGDRLKQLVAIMLDNATEHGEAEKEIEIKLKKDGNMAVFSVSNYGEPIPIEEREKLFDRFYRRDVARTDNSHYGLGLSIANAIVKSHKGKISVNCSGGKIEFIIHFPITR